MPSFASKIYFDIKVKHTIVDAPYHILTGLRILKTQHQKVQDAVKTYVRSGAWYAHSECLLTSLLSSNESDDRSFAVRKILEIRGENENGDSSVRPRQTPEINLDATTLIDLIEWESENIHEPVFTCSLSKKEIKGFLTNPFKPPMFSSHTQSTERAVKLVTEAASSVCRQEARDGFIKVRSKHRQVLPNVETKRDILKTF